MARICIWSILGECKSQYSLRQEIIYMFTSNSSAAAYAQSNFLINQSVQRPAWSSHLDTMLKEYNITDDLCFTPLHYIVLELEQADLRQQLRLNNTIIDTPDILDRSPLHWAVLLGNTTAVETLLELRASPSTMDREQKTPLHDISLSPPLSQASCGQLLLNAGAEVDDFDAWERTPLLIAAPFENVNGKLLKMLLARGADVKIQNIYQQSPLFKSIRGSHDTTELFLNHRADIEVRDTYGNNAMTEAVYLDKPERLRLLLDNGAKTN